MELEALPIIHFVNLKYRAAAGGGNEKRSKQILTLFILDLY